MCGGVVHNVLVFAGYESEYYNPSDFSHGLPTTPVTGLDKLPHGYTKEPANVAVEYFGGYSYVQANAVIAGAADDVASGAPQAWSSVSQAISTATRTFQSELDALNSGPDNWKGTTAEAALNNLRSSFYLPEAVSAAANVMSTLAQSFSTTIATTKNDITSNSTNYYTDIAEYPEKRDQIDQQYATFARSVLEQAYQPNILDIAANNPGFSTGATPTPKPTATTGTGAAARASGGLGASGLIPSTGVGAIGGTSVSVPPGAADTPQSSESATPSSPLSGSPTGAAPAAGSSAGSTSPSTVSTSPTDASASGMDGLSNLSNGLQGLSSPLQSALGQASQAMSAGQRGNPSGLGSGKGPSNLPREGALANGLKGGGGAGGGAHGPAISKAAGAPASTAERTMAAGARAGLSGAPGGAGVGGPAAGAPGGGGQHGRGAQPGQHQPGKMLRRKKNGEEIIGDTEAVVAVLGESPRSDASKPPNAT